MIRVSALSACGSGGDLWGPFQRGCTGRPKPGTWKNRGMLVQTQYNFASLSIR